MLLRGSMDVTTRLAALLGVVVSMSGCSLLFVQVPQPAGEQPIACTSSHAAPTVDLVSGVALLGGAMGSLVASGAADPGALFNPQETLRAGGLVGLVSAAVFLASSAVGFEQVSMCRESEAPPPSAREATSAPARFIVRSSTSGLAL